MEACGLGREDQKQAMEYLHRKNYHQLKALCGSDAAWEKLSLVASCHGGQQELNQLEQVLTTGAEQQALGQLQKLWKILEASGFGDSIRLDFSVGNNMGYYSGVVFQGYLEGIPTGVLSGGQYDKLPRKMGRKAKAIGFAVYLGLLENRSQREDAFDVDTLILHDGTADPVELMAASEKAADWGTVLVTREFPQGRNWKILRQFEKGAWVK
jgi:ATP phosphoribosyltransferase regulatory subunit